MNGSENTLVHSRAELDTARLLLREEEDGNQKHEGITIPTIQNRHSFIEILSHHFSHDTFAEQILGEVAELVECARLEIV
jgi:hypothetical protein